MLHSNLKYDDKQSLLLENNSINRRLFESNKKSAKKEFFDQNILYDCIDEFEDDDTDAGLSFDSLNEEPVYFSLEDQKRNLQ